MGDGFAAATRWSGGALLGEGPVWDTARQGLWFVDIKQHRVHLLLPETVQVQTWETPSQVGWVAPSIDGLFVAGLQDGLARFDPAAGSFTLIATVEPDLPDNRLNDATVAADGSILFGTMDDREASQTGRFYRWDGKTVAPLAIDPVCITNGPAISPDQGTLYHVDTVGGIIYASTIDGEGGVISTREFAGIDPADGSPDGCSVDAAGNVWLGLWGGWRARLYAPDGSIVREVELPCANITKIALGGPDMRTAFVTSARAGLNDEEVGRQPEAGNVFSFEVDVPGIPVPLARL